MKYLISISYDGSKYYGLQKLKDHENTVQGELEKVLSKMNEKFVPVKAAGRTDRGVHALDQKCHFEIDKPTNPYKLRYYLNRSTSKYLYVKTCKEIHDDNFHARFSVKKKEYLYKINVGEYDPIMNDYEYNYNKNLDIQKMKTASSHLIGPHNYKAFVTGKHKTYDSIIDKIDIYQKDNIIFVDIKGKNFYTYMVRNIVRVLILIGSNKLSLNDIDLMLETGNKVLEYSPAPAGGLYLKKIEYWGIKWIKKEE